MRSADRVRISHLLNPRTPIQSTPIQSTLTQSTLTQSTLTQSTLTQSTPTQSTQHLVLPWRIKARNHEETRTPRSRSIADVLNPRSNVPRHRAARIRPADQAKAKTTGSQSVVVTTERAIAGKAVVKAAVRSEPMCHSIILVSSQQNVIGWSRCSRRG